MHAAKKRPQADALTAEFPEFPAATQFLSQLTSGPVAVVMDGDADGISAGRLVVYTLESRNILSVPVFPGKGEYAYSPAVVQKVRSANPTAAVLVDTGATPENPYAPLPVLVLDHHEPLGIPEGVTFVSSHQHQPPETSSLIAYLSCRPLADLGPVEWVALLGVFGDLGDSGAFPYLAPLVRQYTKAQTRRAVTLLNAARRSSECDVALAYRVLCEAQQPRDIVSGQAPGAAQLEQYRREVQVALTEAARAAPVFSEELALVRCHSACLIHGMLASRWANRLRRYPVLAVNTGYLPGEAVFSFRAVRDQDLIALLRDRIGRGEQLGGTIGYGHRSATGGRIPLDRMPELLQALGFDPSAI